MSVANECCHRCQTGSVVTRQWKDLAPNQTPIHSYLHFSQRAPKFGLTSRLGITNVVAGKHSFAHSLRWGLTQGQRY